MKKPRKPTAEHMFVGRSGEHIARVYLQNKGYSILRKNERINRHDEIDIIAYDPEDHVIVFVEVKTRKKHSEEYRPELNATRKKRASMMRAARAWIVISNWQNGYRMDLVCVANGRVVEHVVELNWS